MKLKPLKDTEYTQPFHKWGGWHYTAYPPIGQETVHGPFKTREDARIARQEMKSKTKGDRLSFERAFAKQ
jgi:hypothetical protein